MTEQHGESRHGYGQTNCGIDDAQTDTNVVEEPCNLYQGDGKTNSSCDHAQAGSFLDDPYAQTEDIDLPSATSWPSAVAVANPSSIELDLQGISGSNKFDQDQYYSTSPYDYVWHGVQMTEVAEASVNLAEEQNLQPLERYLTEPITRSQQAIMFGILPAEEDSDRVEAHRAVNCWSVPA
jgi:hypothetical protein